MSSDLRKCISMGPAGMLSPWSAQDYRAGSNRAWFSATDTNWVRLWFDWLEFEKPDGMAKVEELDRQIKTARDDGVKVVLCMHHRYPTYHSEAPAGSSDPFYVPANRSTTGPWGNLIRFLYDRYKPFYPNNPSGAVVNVFEIINEPNLTHKPMDGALAGKVVEMFRSAQAISAEFDHQLALGGPSLSDRESAGSDYIRFYDFIPAMRTAMTQQGFQAHAEFIWTHHNYGDVEYGSNSTTRVRDAINWWTGYDEGDGPVVFCTEGGARVSVMPGATRTDKLNAQRTKVTSKFGGLKSAARVGMQSNYLTYDETSGNYSGLREPDGASRPVYSGWDGLSSGATEIKQWRTGALLPPWTQWDSSLLSQHLGHLEAFAVGSDKRLYSIWTGNGGWTWSSWNNLGGECTSGPGAISIRDGTMDVFVLGPGGRLYQQWWSATGGWSGWQDRGGWLSYDPAVASFNQEHIQVFARAADGTLWHRWWWLTGGWSQWHQLWGGQIWGSPSAVSWADGRMDVVFKGTDNQIHHMYYSNGWHGPSGMRQMPGITGHPKIVSWKPNHLDVICPGANNKLYRLTWDGEWSNWSIIPHTHAPQFSPGAVSSAKGRIDMVFQRDHRLQHVVWA